MRLIVQSNPLGASPEFYRQHPGVIAGCFGSKPFYFVKEWEWSDRPEDAAVLDKEETTRVVTEARLRYEGLKSYQKIKVGFTVVEG